MGYAFIIFAVYVAFESLRKLAVGEAPGVSVPGILIAFASLLLMPWFARYRHDIGHQINSRSLVADSKQTMLCAYMAVALLFGIGLNLVFGWWWADPPADPCHGDLALWEGKRALERGRPAASAKTP